MVDLVTVAGVKITGEVVKEFGKAFKDLKDFGENGARDVESAVKELNTFLNVANPLILPLSLLSSQISSGTLEESMKVSAELVELLQQDSTQAAIKGAISLINLLLTGTSDIIGLVNSLNDSFERIARIQQPLEKLELTLSNLESTFNRVQNTITISIQRIENAITSPFERVEEVLSSTMERIESAITAPFIKIESILVNVGEKIADVWNKIF